MQTNRVKFNACFLCLFLEFDAGFKEWKQFMLMFDDCLTKIHTKLLKGNVYKLRWKKVESELRRKFTMYILNFMAEIVAFISV